ncbi:YbaK/EbsC family protein [Allorhizobium undicola]|uniref:YbaK/EbsC family protein n=1 Tax=Allorhizobium undicola TaxID=78527 RepID=UPI0004841186|nr:YbaK/EbsC family protein [Allorhizobium undicola]
MSLQSVKDFFASHAPDITVLETEKSSATVAMAAEAHGVDPDQIAKTLCIRAGEEVILLVAAGMARLDNRKFRDRFGAKPKMPEAEEVLARTGHPVGGVCPFGLATPMAIYCDRSLQAHAEILPAAGAGNSAVRLTPDRLIELTGAEWVDVCQSGSGIAG